MRYIPEAFRIRGPFAPFSFSRRRDEGRGLAALTAWFVLVVFHFADPFGILLHIHASAAFCRPLTRSLFIACGRFLRCGTPVA